MSHSIAEAAAHSGLSIDTLRYYERIGLIEPPARDAGGRRCYTDEDLTWLLFVVKLRRTGMPIAMMVEYAQLRRLGDSSAGRRKEILEEQRESVREQLAHLQSCLELLDYKIDNYDRICRDAGIAESATREEIPA
jgi:DNA-binding transcriptional MerR regulator